MKEYHMLWSFDHKTMTTDIQEGLAFYLKKYNVSPTVFYINPQYGLHQFPGVKVIVDAIVTPCHVYIGAE